MKISDVQDHETIFQALSKRYLHNFAYDQSRHKRKLVFDHNLNLEKLKSNIDEIFGLHGIHPWQTKDGPVERYAGFSLTANPLLQDNLNINASSLGSTQLENKNFFYASYEKVNQVKNSYFDSYAFTERTPASSVGYLNEILGTCKRTIIRSRLMMINGKFYNEELISDFKNAPVGDSRFGWHKDEPIHANLRINIPIHSNNSFVFEMENESPYELLTGKAYSWDTSIPHRVYCRNMTEEKRINLIIGVSPWFDYINGEWIPNEFCGKKDPQQMIIDGDVFDWLKLSKGDYGKY